MGKTVLWLAAVVALFTVGVVGATGPPAIQTSDGIVAATLGAKSISSQWLASEASKGVIHISPMLVVSERDCLDRFIAVNKNMAQVQPTTAKNCITAERTGTQAPIVRHAIYDQAIFAREPVPHWLRV